MGGAEAIFAGLPASDNFMRPPRQNAYSDVVASAASALRGDAGGGPGVRLKIIPSGAVHQGGSPRGVAYLFTLNLERLAVSRLDSALDARQYNLTPADYLVVLDRPSASSRQPALPPWMRDGPWARLANGARILFQAVLHPDDARLTLLGPPQ